ncbi:MAG: hypothetical protein ACFFDN_47335, partial [Candidatus Hodarchaeota archaeon]
AIHVINTKVVGINTAKYFEFVFRKLILFNLFLFLIYNQVLDPLAINLPIFLSFISGSYALLISIYYKLGLEIEDKEFIHDKILNIRAKLLYE